MKWIDRLVVLLAVLSLAGILLATPDPFVRDAVCGKPGCLQIHHPTFVLPLIYDISMGVLMSAVFYWLLVWIPTWRKRRRLRKHLTSSYEWFRREITVQCMFAASRGRSVSTDDVDANKTMLGFRTYFKGASTLVDGNRWHDVANGMTPEIRTDMLAAVAILRDDVTFVLNNTDIDDQKSFDLLHGLQRSGHITLLDPTHGEEDGHLLSLIWEVMAGWNWIEGYPKKPHHDRVQRIIDRI